MNQRSGFSSRWWCSAICMLAFVLVGCSDAPPSTKPAASSAAPAVQPEQAKQPDEVEPVAEADPPRTTETAEVVEPEQVDVAEKPPAKREMTPSEPLRKPKPKVALSVPEPPAYVYEPQVIMSKQHADTCLVKTGDQFPIAELSDLAGEKHSLKELFGEKLTVVVFWSNSNRLGREQFQRLEAETVAPFQNTGLTVLAINITDPPEQISDLLPADGNVGFKSLVDHDATLYAQVATAHHPRTYLLDADGKILWFSIEYSRSMARDLSNAIHVHLGNRITGES